MPKKTHGIFITGTNTDVGKTYVGVLLSKKLTQQDIQVIPKKPVESGCGNQNGTLIPNDAIALKNAAGFKGDLSDVCNSCFEAAISPARAAQLSNTEVTLTQLADFCLKDSEGLFTLVEGAGGFYSPLTQDALNADLATKLKLPIILVASNRLGCINDVLLSVEAIKNKGLKLVAVFLTEQNKKTNSDNNQIDNPQMNNAEDLKNYISCPVISIPYDSNESVIPDTLVEHLVSNKI